jgi:hypothetical protein
MIDTDKYEGHTPGPWLTKGSCPEEDPEFFTIVSDWEESVYCRVATVSTRWSAPMNEANARLIRAAPDLLAEVKSWRDSYIDLWNICIELYDGDIELHRFKDWLDERSGGDLYPMKHKEESE